MNHSVKIPDKLLELPSSARGAYVLEFHLTKKMKIVPGRLGEKVLGKGWYYYVGSAMNGLRGRLTRHITGPRKIHWHIDYITYKIQPVRIWVVRSEKRLESELVRVVSGRCAVAIAGFGCSDSREDISHLFYSKLKINFVTELACYGQAFEAQVVVR